MKYADLSDKAKERVHQLLEPDIGWWEDVYEQAKEDGVAKGFQVDDICFEGFYCQGSGAGWSGRILWGEYLKRKWEETGEINYHIAYAIRECLMERTPVSMKRYYTTYLPEGVQWWDRAFDGASVDAPDTVFHGALVQDLYLALPDNWMLDLEKEVEHDVEEYAQEIYKNLEEEYDYQTSEEYIADLCAANEYEFNEEGEWL